jgi:hypothetical protein
MNYFSIHVNIDIKSLSVKSFGKNNFVSKEKERNKEE